MVWPRCITVAIPGTGYALPSESEREKPHTGLLHIQVVSHDGRAISPGEVGLQVRWPVADLLVAKNQEETRVKALPGGGVLSSKEITLPVEDPRAQLLCVRWYTREVRDEETGVVVTPERLDGEASVVLDELMRQAVSSSSSSVGGGAEGLEADVAIAQWGPVPVAAELEPPIGADIKSVGGAKGGGKRGGGWFGRAAGAVTGVVSKSASGVVAGYKARSIFTLVPIRPRRRGERRSLRTFPVVSLRPGSLAFNPRPRRLSTPLLTPFNSTPTFARMERP